MRATFSDGLELRFVVVPESFETAKSLKGSEFDEEVSVEVKKLNDEIVVAICCC